MCPVLCEAKWHVQPKNSVNAGNGQCNVERRSTRSSWQGILLSPGSSSSCQSSTKRSVVVFTSWQKRSKASGNSSWSWWRSSAGYCWHSKAYGSWDGRVHWIWSYVCGRLRSLLPLCSRLGGHWSFSGQYQLISPFISNKWPGSFDGLLLRCPLQARMKHTFTNLAAVDMCIWWAELWFELSALQLFASSGLESPQLGKDEALSNDMGLFLQKTNIIRDYLEDIEELPAPRWPSPRFSVLQ